MNRCKTSSVIREMQIKVTARHRETAEMKHRDTTERRRGRGEAGAPAAAVGAETAPRPLQPAARPRETDLAFTRNVCVRACEALFLRAERGFPRRGSSSRCAQQTRFLLCFHVFSIKRLLPLPAGGCS